MQLVKENKTNKSLCKCSQIIFLSSYEFSSSFPDCMTFSRDQGEVGQEEIVLFALATLQEDGDMCGLQMKLHLYRDNMQNNLKPVITTEQLLAFLTNRLCPLKPLYYLWLNSTDNYGQKKLSSHTYKHKSMWFILWHYIWLHLDNSGCQLSNESLDLMTAAYPLLSVDGCLSLSLLQLYELPASSVRSSW